MSNLGELSRPPARDAGGLRRRAHAENRGLADHHLHVVVYSGNQHRGPGLSQQPGQHHLTVLHRGRLNGQTTDLSPDPGGVGDQRLFAFPFRRLGDLPGSSEGGVPSGAQLLLLPRGLALLPGGGHAELPGQHPVLYPGHHPPLRGHRGGLSRLHRHPGGPLALRLALPLRIYPGPDTQDSRPQVFRLGTPALGEIRRAGGPGDHPAPVAGGCRHRAGAPLVLQAVMSGGHPGGGAAP